MYANKPRHASIVGFQCTNSGGSAATFENSVVCDNGQDYDCDSGCNVIGAPGVCSNNQTECAAYCSSNPTFCVVDTGYFAGPYDGCFGCGGECWGGNYTCPDEAVCEDAPGGTYDCACATGYTGNGTVPCEDVNECALNGTHNCAPHATCNNTIGSFVCICNAGYEGSGVFCNGRYFYACLCVCVCVCLSVVYPMCVRDVCA